MRATNIMHPLEGFSNILHIQPLLHPVIVDQALPVPIAPLDLLHVLLPPVIVALTILQFARTQQLALSNQIEVILKICV